QHRIDAALRPRSAPASGALAGAGGADRARQHPRRALLHDALTQPDHEVRMLTHPTLSKLEGLRLSGMARALREQEQMPDIDRLGFLERLGLLVDRETTEREDLRLKTRLKQARLR